MDGINATLVNIALFLVIASAVIPILIILAVVLLGIIANWVERRQERKRLRARFERKRKEAQAAIDATKGRMGL